MLGCEFMDNERMDAPARGMGARANRRQALRWIGAAALTTVGLARVAAPAGAQSASQRTGDTCENGACAEPPSQLPATGVGLPEDTSRVAGLGLAAAAVLVAGKLIRDKERDPEL